MQDEQTNEANKNYNILIVDDEMDVQKALKMTIERSKLFNSDISVADNGKEALAELEKKEFDLVLSDFRMPGMDGIELLNNIREKYPNIIRILITGYSDINIAKKAITKAKVHNYIEKPWNQDELLTVITEELRIQGKLTEMRFEEPAVFDNVEDAIKLIGQINDQVQTNPNVQIGKEVILFEFNSSEEFNKFNQKVKKMSNVIIDEVYMFENKYKVTVCIYQGSCEKIL